MDTKAWYASMTIWGGLAAIGAGLGGAYAGFLAKDPTAISAGLMAAFGGINAVIGRFKASATIGSAPAPAK